jgi:hypothetical protein
VTSIRNRGDVPNRRSFRGSGSSKCCCPARQRSQRRPDPRFELSVRNCGVDNQLKGPGNAFRQDRLILLRQQRLKILHQVCDAVGKGLRKNRSANEFRHTMVAARSNGSEVTRSFAFWLRGGTVPSVCSNIITPHRSAQRAGKAPPDMQIVKIEAVRLT